MREEFDFTSPINRRNTSCYKWDWDERRTGCKGLLPFWVADMDFKIPSVVLEALQSRVEHGVFGYTACPESLVAVMRDWFLRRYSWEFSSNDALEIPGMVPFLHMYIQGTTTPGDAIIIQEPVYYPFRQAIEKNGRRVAENPLVYENGSWKMNLKGLEKVIEQTGARLMILCSPHNPVGRVWTQEELLDLADVCRAGNVTVISDEIHGDLIHKGYQHVPWLTLPKNRLPSSMTLVSATKSFNLPGLTVAWAIVQEEALNRNTKKLLDSLGLGNGVNNPLAYTATEAAWRDGEPWLKFLVNYIDKNNNLLREILTKELPAAVVSPLEGTYLAWVNLSAYDYHDTEDWQRLIDAGVWFSKGTDFGKGGKGHIRINLACPKAQLLDGLNRMVCTLQK